MNPLDGYEKPSPLTKNQKKIYSAIGIAILLFIVWYFAVGLGRGPSAYGSGDGTIDVFPQADSVKSYRLDAKIEVFGKAKNLLSNYKEYKINSADWSNGGTLSFSGCVTTDIAPRSFCKADDGTSYYVEVIDAPPFDQGN